MLRSLSIRDIVLIDALELRLEAGLNVLTGETGAGKSILLDALGLALGRRARADLVRPGAAEGVVTAVFEIGAEHPARAVLNEAGVPADDDAVILRRAVAADGRARGFVNDQRAGAELMARLGEALVEVHGQHDDRGLLDPAGHRGLLDAFAGLDPAPLRAAWAALREADQALAQADAAAQAAARDAEWLAHASAELSALDARPGEEAALDAERRRMQGAARIAGDLARARAGMTEAEGALADAARRLALAGPAAEGALDAPLAALDRALGELSEAQDGAAAAADRMAADPDLLDRAEERLFALRAVARKHQTRPDDLPALAAELAGRVRMIEDGAAARARLAAAQAGARAGWDAAAARASATRRAAAERLDGAVAAELAPLKMERAAFITAIAPGPEGPEGADRVSFTVMTNPGAKPGPIDRIASGGELSRFLLALKVCLSARAEGLTLIFDEIDRGVGGATADAVGRRLARLAERAQVLVVTHSPQVAALGAAHWRIEKRAEADAARTRVERLDPAARVEEIARMLAGETVTDGARAAAQALLAAR